MKQLPDLAAERSLGRSKSHYRSPLSSGAGGTGIVPSHMEETGLMEAEQSGLKEGSDDALDIAEGMDDLEGAEGLDDLGEDMTGGDEAIEDEAGEEDDSEAEEESEGES